MIASSETTLLFALGWVWLVGFNVELELHSALFALILFLLLSAAKTIRALAKILAIFLCFDCQLLLSHACHKQYKA